MKRSEMVEKLITPISWIGSGMFTGRELRRLASELLTVMEDGGVLPPAHTRMVEYTDSHGNKFENIETKYEWEPENDIP